MGKRRESFPVTIVSEGKILLLSACNGLVVSAGRGLAVSSRLGVCAKAFPQHSTSNHEVKKIMTDRVVNFPSCCWVEFRSNRLECFFNQLFEVLVFYSSGNFFKGIFRLLPAYAETQQGI